MQNLFFILALLLLSSVQSNATPNEAYTKKMNEAITHLDGAKTVADFVQAANEFSVISKVSKDEWLPLYYYAHIHVILVYVDSAADMQKKDKYLDQAETAINKIATQFPKESEIQILKGWYLISRLALDPPARGATYYPAYAKAIDDAVALDPLNPRARFFKVSNDIGAAQFMGQPTESYCPRLEALYNEWDQYKIVSTLHPKWGKEEVKKKMVEICPAK